MCPWATAAPRNAALAEAQIAIRTSNYSSSEVRAPGHIRNKTVTAAMQTPAIENHAGAREFDTEIPLFLLSNIRVACMSCTAIFKPFLSAASQTAGSVQPSPFTMQAPTTFATSVSSMGESAWLASIQSSVNCRSLVLILRFTSSAEFHVSYRRSQGAVDCSEGDLVSTVLNFCWS